MADTLTPAARSAHMAKIRSKDTKPEVLVRRLLFRLGYRFRLHGKGLPGRPDIVFKARRKVVFVHGCFWHGHAGCASAHMPKTRPDFWAEKFSKNAQRDEKNVAALEALGYDVAVVWECEAACPGLARKLESFLGPTRFDG
jgi:DNA mismatch endonuclease (patch repair protein)